MPDELGEAEIYLLLARAYAAAVGEALQKATSSTLASTGREWSILAEGWAATAREYFTLARECGAEPEPGEEDEARAPVPGSAAP